MTHQQAKGCQNPENPNLLDSIDSQSVSVLPSAHHHDHAQTNQHDLPDLCSTQQVFHHLVKILQKTQSDLPSQLGEHKFMLLTNQKYKKACKTVSLQAFALIKTLSAAYKTNHHQVIQNNIPLGTSPNKRKRYSEGTRLADSSSQSSESERECESDIDEDDVKDDVFEISESAIEKSAIALDHRVLWFNDKSDQISHISLAAIKTTTQPFSVKLHAPRYTNIPKPQLKFHDFPPDNSKKTDFPHAVAPKWHFPLPNDQSSSSSSSNSEDQEDGQKKISPHIEKLLHGIHQSNNNHHTKVPPHPYLNHIKYALKVSSKFQVQDSVPAIPQPYLPFDQVPFTYVDTLTELHLLLKRLESETEIAVDLEHHDLRSFQGITCLMQISTRNEDFIIDTLALRKQVQQLDRIFANPSILKIFHGADSDIIWLQRDFGIYVVNLFDTGQAARVLELPSYSLGYLLECFCGVNSQHKKAFQLADWRTRPLTEMMIQYARQDTHYLFHIYDCIRLQLIKSNKMKQALENSSKVSLKMYQKALVHDEIVAFKKDKRNFNREQTLVYQALSEWRDKTAREEDESVRYTLPTPIMLNMAYHAEKCTTLHGLFTVVGNNVPRLVQNYSTYLLELIRTTIKRKDENFTSTEKDIAVQQTQVEISSTKKFTASDRDLNNFEGVFYVEKNISYGKTADINDLQAANIVQVRKRRSTLFISDSDDDSNDDMNEDSSNNDNDSENVGNDDDRKDCNKNDNGDDSDDDADIENQDEIDVNSCTIVEETNSMPQHVEVARTRFNEAISPIGSSIMINTNEVVRVSARDRSNLFGGADENSEEVDESNVIENECNELVKKNENEEKGKCSITADRNFKKKPIVKKKDLCKLLGDISEEILQEGSKALKKTENNEGTLEQEKQHSTKPDVNENEKEETEIISLRRRYRNDVDRSSHVQTDKKKQKDIKYEAIDYKLITLSKTVTGSNKKDNVGSSFDPYKRLKSDSNDDRRKVRYGNTRPKSGQRTFTY